MHNLEKKIDISNRTNVNSKKLEKLLRGLHV